MPNLDHLLREHREILPVLAQRWGVKTTKRSTDDDIINALLIAMLDPRRLEAVYDGLDLKARGVIQSLSQAKPPNRNQMSAAIFSAMNGAVRRLGPGGIEREKPHEKPATTAEALYYWGLVGFTNLPGPGGALVNTAYIPDDLAALLPIHKTSYSRDVLEAEMGKQDEIVLEGDDDGEADVAPAPVPSAEPPAPPAPDPQTDAVRLSRLNGIANARPADTSLVDDFTTLLAFLQVSEARAEAVPYSIRLDDAARKQLMPHLIVKDGGRLDFALLLGVTAGMVEFYDGRAFCKRAEARRWLESPRAAQLQQLAEAWVRSTDYIDLAHVPNLTLDENGYTGLPDEARREMLRLIHESVPLDAPWSVDAFVVHVFGENPAFQRAEFDGWYVRGADGGYLRGVENWDAVDGALVEFYLTGPLHWLGLMTVGDGAVQLNAYGRAFISGEEYPSRAEPDERPTLDNDGTLRVGRGYSRFERFQLARFTSWGKPPASPSEPYVYRVDGDGIQRGAGQGIQTDQIEAFLKRVTGAKALPQYVASVLGNWRGGAQTSVVLERLIVLRTNSVEALDAIVKEPNLRRYLGARLGPTDAIVRADQWEALQRALGDAGVTVEARLG
ncbi:MAG: hypothetical protein MUC99_07095 [Anaerolineae bacterium]|nr:hypothetical protein [Anaerolineae bacterium]